MTRLRYLRAPALVLALLATIFAAGCSGSSQMQSDDDGMMDDGRTTTDIQRVDYDPENLTYPDLPDVQVPAVEEMTLGNGMKIFLIEDHELPTISASARLRAGEAWVPADHAGLASMTGTVMRSGGTQSMSSDDINQLLEDLGASVETGVGNTSARAYMNTLAENVDRVLPVFVDVLTRPAFAQDKIEQAKTQVRGSISRRNDNTGQITSRVFNDLIYGADSPYAREPEYYTVDNIDRDDLVNFHGQYFHPNNTIMSVWGDFDTADMKRKLRSAFGGWAREPGFTPPSPPRPQSDDGYSVNFVQKDDVNQSTVRMGYLGELTRDDPDYFPVIVMNEVLSGGFTSRLFNQVRTELGLAYSVGGAYLAGYDRPNFFYSQVQTESGSTVQATRAVLNEVEKLRQSPPSENEVELAKDAYLNSFVFNFDTRSEVLGRLMTYETYGYPRDFLQQIRQGVAAVTPQDVYRVSQKYLHPDRMKILVVGRQQDFDQPLSTLAQGGQVNEIDISIPTGAPGEDTGAPVASEEDMAAGRDLLAQVREAMGGDAYDRIQNMRQTNEVTQGGQTVEIPVAVDIVGGRLRVGFPAGGATIPVIDDGEQLVLRTPGGIQPAPPQIRQLVTGLLNGDLTYLMTQASELEAARQEPVTVDGVAHPALRITPPEGEAFTLLIDPDTMMPAEIRQETVVPGQGPTEVRTVLSDYREEAGVMVPYQNVTYQDGNQAASSTLQSFETNVDFPEDYFSTE